MDDSPPYAGQLYACVGGSHVARGILKSLDLTHVREAEGVVDVITANEIPGKLDIGPVFPGDPLLADNEIEYLGQPLFAVLATSHDLARRAAKLGQADVEKLEPVLDLQQAIKQELYVRPPHRMQRGDVDPALENSFYRFRGILRVGGQEHFYLEGQASIAIPEEDGGVTVHTSTQNPTEAQKLVAEVLDIPMNLVNVVTRRMGGGFGGKETQGSPWSCIAAVFARRTGKPVVCRLSRHDDMVMTGKRHNFLNRYEVGTNEEGKIEGIRYQLAGQCGYSPDLSDAIVDRAMFHCDNAYYIPNVLIDGL
ncbi:MAG: molybdopterin-dependent oxidoreductase, partial [Gammaproteobacteria bacterium]